ncbi:hypothetical protein COX74_03420 [bacterium (Candidatus Gribaldobacteria) CG_4_10_14_0_2_um_filter_41_16]|uniref:Uncharacterized protein n=2 Tax=Candidatus Gribaldobacteria TaxID=2798536 RepID=A0A2M7VHL1_9BACT|nr:MAG: hypothetical protein AUJ36_02270 [Parcubacteria group bacterium CG1_02_41_26]PIR91728.1 MAG: hypothetical protein COU03_00790 [bacterium (Candidatus Gribaldobacteria) CG10_big_fil_rev_8_21_14_0_10_41_12]PJA01233.1 MAG: hypothetical protein COX74_03420 [bacterium (Candidatus Gribaldobacteria) CG_4_10_14_0_2_um_filter_41_16]
MKLNLREGVTFVVTPRYVEIKKNGERVFFYSVPQDLSKKAVETDINMYLSAKGLTARESTLRQYE